MSKEKNGNSNKKIVILLSGVAVLLVVVIVVLVIMLMSASKKTDDSLTDKDYKKLEITEANYAQIEEMMEKSVEEGYLETYMNTNWTFPDGTSPSVDAIFGNSPNNTKPINAVVTVRDTGEVIYESGVLPVGAQVSEIILLRDLDAGKYDAVCTISLLNENEDGTYEEYSSAGFNLTIRVEN